jgi:hypothetical protein
MQFQPQIKKVLFGVGFIISTIRRRKSQCIVAQILYHIVGALFKSLSISFEDVLLLLRVEIKVGRLSKTRFVLHSLCIDDCY